LSLPYYLVDDDFIYEDEEEEEPDVDVENGYYNAKGTLLQLPKHQLTKHSTQRRRSKRSTK
jgi:hypothetical protein